MVFAPDGHKHGRGRAASPLPRLAVTDIHSFDDLHFIAKRHSDGIITIET